MQLLVLESATCGNGFKCALQKDLEPRFRQTFWLWWSKTRIRRFDHEFKEIFVKWRHFPKMAHVSPLAPHSKSVPGNDYNPMTTNTITNLKAVKPHVTAKSIIDKTVASILIKLELHMVDWMHCAKCIHSEKDCSITSFHTKLPLFVTYDSVLS